MNVTNWFPSYVQPARCGVYQRICHGDLHYSRWDGAFWMLNQLTAEKAAMVSITSFNQVGQGLKWRGLAEDPAKGKQ